MSKYVNDKQNKIKSVKDEHFRLKTHSRTRVHVLLAASARATTKHNHFTLISRLIEIEHYHIITIYT